jgi:protein arginine N-methyltransferase 1
MYSLSAYGSMIADHVRINSYAEALRRSVRPGSVVADIGTGPGIFAVLACQLGASRVYAIEPSDIIQIAKEVAAANGCSDRIVFVQDLSTRVTLPEPADVIVSDLRGVLPLYQLHIPAVVDARRRLLAPGGTLIPRRDSIWVAVVESPERYGSIVDPWEKNSLRQDLRAARKLELNNLCKAHLVPDQLLADPELWATLEYQTIEQVNFEGEVRFGVKRPGTAHGIAVWFETELIDGVSFSSARDTAASIYGSLFFPWTQPVALTTDQSVSVNLAAKLLGTDYMWRWTTCVRSSEKTGEVRAQFSQSQLAGAVLSLTSLRKAGSDHVPRLSDEGTVDRRILEMMDGQATLEEIARAITQEFPRRFARWQDGLTAAAALSAKYSR